MTRRAALLLAVALSVVTACSGSDRTDDDWPDVVVEALADGGPVPSSTALGAATGRPTVVAVWAVWCEPCRHELPALDALARERGDSVVVTGVNHGDDPGRARAFLAELGVGFSSLRDPDGRLVSALGVVSLPATFVVDARGRIAWRRLGVVESAEIEVALDALSTQSSARPMDG